MSEVYLQIYIHSSTDRLIACFGHSGGGSGGNEHELIDEYHVV